MIANWFVPKKVVDRWGKARNHTAYKALFSWLLRNELNAVGNESSTMKIHLSMCLRTIGFGSWSRMYILPFIVSAASRRSWSYRWCCHCSWYIHSLESCVSSCCKEAACERELGLRCFDDQRSFAFAIQSASS